MIHNFPMYCMDMKYVLLMVYLVLSYAIVRLLRAPGWERRGLRAARECLIGSHFLGGLMSFQNLTRSPKSTRREAHLLFCREVLSELWRIALKGNSRRWNKLKKTQTSLLETKREDFKAEHPGTRAPLSAGKGGWTFKKRKKLQP